MIQSASTMILEPKKIKSVTVSIVVPSICHEVMRLDAMILVFWMLSFKPTFYSLFSLSSRGCLVFLCFLTSHGVICISEVVDISSGNLDSSLCFFQPSVSHDVLCIEVKWAGWQYTPLTSSFSYLEPVCCSISSSNCCFLTCIQVF